MVCTASPPSLDAHKKWAFQFTAHALTPLLDMQSPLAIKPPPIYAHTLRTHLQAIAA